MALFLCYSSVVFLYFVQIKWANYKEKNDSFSEMPESFGLLDLDLQNKISGLVKALQIASLKKDEAEESFNAALCYCESKHKELEVLKRNLTLVAAQKETAEKYVAEAEALLAMSLEELSIIKNKIS